MSIGVEMISNPSIIFLDEPTSGLDSFKALGICQLLKKLASEKGKTVVSTIHSPSSSAFYYFDRLILMCDGFIVFQGDAKFAMEHFELTNFKAPKYGNPADYFMKVLTVRYPKEQEDIDKLTTLNAQYRNYIRNRIAQ